ncbi:MAG: transglycosylase domain-containing protein [Bacilli bacterium]|nr:transglycosylase domain-containing protein [Bacilli bacterium]
MKLFKKLIKFSLISLLLMFLAYNSIYLYAKVTPKLSINSANGYYLYDKNGELFSGNSNDGWIKLKDISPNLINATISIEDKNFFNHDGFDYLRIVKAMYVNIKNKMKLQGASTITQQYARNLFLDFDKNWGRKINEAWLTVRLESHYSKDEILEGYLNTINYGGIFGIENASKYYFGKSASDLTLAEATILAGIPKSPSYYSPLVDQTAAKKRQQIILNSMVKNEFITEKQKNDAAKVELTYIGKSQKANLSTLMYYQNAVIDELKRIKSIPASFIETGGLKIYTNLDIEVQKNMEANINKYMDPKSSIEIASIVMDPNTGKIVALTGGRDYSKSQYNRAISAKRQVGSTMKPFLYYTALENGFTPSTTFTSTKTTFTFSEDKTYSPQNYGNSYPNKPISMAAALAYSDNIYAVKTHLFLGEEMLVNTMKRVGVKTPVAPIPSLALGSEEISLLEMMTGYAALANEGYKIEPSFITKVEDINGNILYEHNTQKESVLNKSIVYILNEMLNNCYATEFIDYNYPTCMSIASKLSKKYAIKTGTTDTDHLIFGYNKNLLMGLWSGYDNNTYTTSAEGSPIKHIWADTIESYFKDKDDNSWYNMPINIVGALVEPISGNLVTKNSNKKKILYYIKGTEPTSTEQNLDDLIPTIKTD